VIAREERSYSFPPSRNVHGETGRTTENIGAGKTGASACGDVSGTGTDEYSLCARTVAMTMPQGISSPSAKSRSAMFSPRQNTWPSHSVNCPETAAPARAAK